MAITASMVKELRERTSAGMMECKKALTETDGDMEAAVQLLRTSGAAKADKKAGRVAAEGVEDHQPHAPQHEGVDQQQPQQQRPPAAGPPDWGGGGEAGRLSERVRYCYRAPERRLRFMLRARSPYFQGVSVSAQYSDTRALILASNSSKANGLTR